MDTKTLINDISDAVLNGIPDVVNIEKLSAREKADYNYVLSELTKLRGKGVLNTEETEIYNTHLDTMLNFALIDSKENLRIYIDSALAIAVSVGSICANIAAPNSGILVERIGNALIKSAQKSY